MLAKQCLVCYKHCLLSQDHDARQLQFACVGMQPLGFGKACHMHEDVTRMTVSQWPSHGHCCDDGGGVREEQLPHILGTHLAPKLLLSATRHYLVSN